MKQILLPLTALLLAPLAALHAAELQSPSPLCANHLVILRASGMKPDSPTVVAPLNNLGKQGALEEAFAQRGLSFRPWDGQNFQDYNWIYEPGTNFSFRVQAAGAKDCARAVVSLWDWFGNKVYSKSYRAFPVDDVLTVKAECRGVWLVTFDAYAGATGASLKSRLVKSFGTPVDATQARSLWREKNDYLIGSCFFPQRYYHWGKKWGFDNPPFLKLTPAEGIDRLAGLAARAGITVLRVDDMSRVGDIEMEVMDILQRHSIQADLKVHLPQECFVGQTLERDEKVFGAWEADMDLLIGRLLKPADKLVAFVELGNEPAHHEFWRGTREQYQWLFTCAQKKIHVMNPAIPVLPGGTCPPGSDLSGDKLKDPVAYEEKRKAQEEWYRAFYHDMAGTGNVWAYHQHSAVNTNSVAWREWERAELAKNGFAGTYLQTEGGTCAWRPDLEVTTWPTVPQKILYSWSRGEKGWLQFDLAKGTAPSRYNDQKGWSLIHAHDFTPKFQYGAIAAMTKTLAGCSLERTLARDPAGETPSLAVLFKHSKGRMVAWFGALEKAGLRIKSDASTMTFIDPMGNEIETRPSGDATLTYEPSPQYLLLAGATRAESTGQEGNYK